jgi:TolB protein
LALSVLACAVCGCGGGGGGGGSTPQGATGSATFVVDWPAARVADIPAAAHSARIQVLSGTAVLATQDVARPAAGGRTTTHFGYLPSGQLSYAISAYAQPLCAGQPISTANNLLTVTGGQDTLVPIAVESASPINTVSVSVITSTVTVGSTITVNAVARDTNNQPVLATFTWLSSAPTVATVDGSGHVTGVSVGSALITARETGTGKTGGVTITVTAKPAGKVQVTVAPGTSGMQIGQHVQLMATARNDLGPVTTTFHWASAQPAIASVDASGYVTGVSVGSAVITATDNTSAQSATATINVSAPVPSTPWSGKIVFESDMSGSLELYLLRPDGSVQQLTSDGTNNADAVFSYDGTQIAYDSGAAGSRQIMGMNAGGGGRQVLVTNGLDNVDPAFSRDGSKLAYASGTATMHDIYVKDLASGTTTQLTHGEGDNLHPGFSLDGSQLVFSSSRGGNYDIYVMGADGGGITQLTTESYWDGHPMFSPDGAKIAFSSNRADDHTAYQTHQMNPDGNSQVRLLNVTHCSRTPCYSPDGAQLVFASNPDRNFDLYMASVDGSGFHLIFSGPGREMHPSWGPE